MVVSMKLKKLSEKLLKLMIEHYVINSNTFFTFDFFKHFYPDINENLISDALKVLAIDGFVQILYADNRPYVITLVVNGILAANENTMLKKGYKLFKEIKSIL